jgi:hypothetical protein
MFYEKFLPIEGFFLPVLFCYWIRMKSARFLMGCYTTYLIGIKGQPINRLYYAYNQNFYNEVVAPAEPIIKKLYKLGWRQNTRPIETNYFI